MSKQHHIGQGSTKYPRESARPTEAEEEGLQVAGEPLGVDPKALLKEEGEGEEEGGGGREQKERSQGAIPQVQVMEEALIEMLVQFQGEGDDASMQG